jgi:hypothetical protein
MSKATKRKYVTREVLEGDVKLSDGQSIVRVSLYITVVQKKKVLVMQMLVYASATRTIMCVGGRS